MIVLVVPAYPYYLLCPLSLSLSLLRPLATIVTVLGTTLLFPPPGRYLFPTLPSSSSPTPGLNLHSRHTLLFCSFSSIHTHTSLTHSHTHASPRPCLTSSHPSSPSLALVVAIAIALAFSFVSLTSTRYLTTTTTHHPPPRTFQSQSSMYRINNIGSPFNC